MLDGHSTKREQNEIPEPRAHDVEEVQQAVAVSRVAAVSVAAVRLVWAAELRRSLWA